MVLRWRDRAVAATATATEPPADYAALAAIPLTELWTLEEAPE